jgi:flagellar biosynthesis protein FliR
MILGATSTLAPLSELLSKLAGNELAGFILVLARVTPLFLIAPPFSSPMIPPRVRGIIAVGISIGLTPIVMHGQHISGDVLELAGFVLSGALVGLAFAFSLAILFASIEAAGAFADLGAGFSYGNEIDPFSGNPSGPFSSLYSMMGIAVFFAIGGEAWVLTGLDRSFDLVPLTQMPQLSTLVGGVVHIFSTVFAGALEIAAPVVIALLITDVAFGVVSRVVPQLNVFAVGFPVKVAVALLIVGVSIPFVGGWIADQVSTTVGAALSVLHPI